MEEVFSRTKRLGFGIVIIIIMLLYFIDTIIPTMAFSAATFYLMPIYCAFLFIVMLIQYGFLIDEQISLSALTESKIDIFSKEELRVMERSVDRMGSTLDITLLVGWASVFLGLLTLFSLDSITIY